VGRPCTHRVCTGRSVPTGEAYIPAYTGVEGTQGGIYPPVLPLLGGWEALFSLFSLLLGGWEALFSPFLPCSGRLEGLFSPFLTVLGGWKAFSSLLSHCSGRLESLSSQRFLPKMGGWEASFPSPTVKRVGGINPGIPQGVYLSGGLPPYTSGCVPLRVCTSGYTLGVYQVCTSGYTLGVYLSVYLRVYLRVYFSVYLRCTLGEV